MPKPTLDSILANLKALGRSRGYDRNQVHLGFGSDQEEAVFRAVAISDPTPVLVTPDMPKRLKKAADELVKAGTFRTAIKTSGTVYRLTNPGKRRAVSLGVIKEKRDA